MKAPARLGLYGLVLVAVFGVSAFTANSDDVTECLVMAGTPVIKSQAEAAGLYRDYEGERYWFCCAACGPLFDANPQQYVNVV